MRRIKINVRTIIKVILIPGLPLGIYYFFYGAGLLVKYLPIELDPEMPIVVEGFLGIIGFLFCGLVVGLVLWGMWNLVEKVLEPFDEYFKHRRLLSTLSAEEDARLAADEDQQYRQRIGVEE